MRRCFKKLTDVENLEYVKVANHWGETWPAWAHLPIMWHPFKSNDSRYNATASARHSSIDDDTSPRTEPGVWPGLYHEVLCQRLSTNLKGIVRRLTSFCPWEGWESVHRSGSSGISCQKCLRGLLPQGQSSSLHLHIPQIISQIHDQEVHDWPPEVRKPCCPRHCKGWHHRDEWMSVPHLRRQLIILLERWFDGILGALAARIFWEYQCEFWAKDSVGEISLPTKHFWSRLPPEYHNSSEIQK